MKKSILTLLIVLLFALVSISTVCAATDFNDTDNTQAIQTNTNGMNAIDEVESVVTPIDSDSALLALESDHQDEKNSANTEIYVRNNGTDADGYGSQETPYKTIKYAVSKAQANDIIHIYEGRYDENSIVLSNNISIIGENKNVIITSSMDNKKVFESLYNENGNNISLRFENLTFDTIKPGQYNAILNLRNEGKTEIIDCVFENTDGQYNVWSSSPEIIIENCEFRNICFTSAGNLIYLTGKGTPKITNTRFNKITSTANGVVTLINIINKPTAATIDNLTVGEVSGKFYAIDMKNSGYGDINNSITIKNSKFENNEFEKTNNNQGGALFIAAGSSKLEITNSTIAENTAARGIFVGTSNETGILANNNIIYNNTGNILYSTGNPITNYNLEYNYWGSENPDLGDLNIHIIATDKEFSTMKTIKNPVDPTMDVKVNNTINEGENLTIEVTLNEDAKGIITITGINGVEPQTLENGKATFTIENLKANQYPITISYNGSLDYKAKAYETTITVKGSAVPTDENKTSPQGESKTSPSSNKASKAATKIIAKNKKFKAKTKVKKYTITLKTKAGKAIKKVQVTIKIGKKTFKAKTNAKGKATFKIKKLTKKGKYKAVIKFKGNANYKACSKKVKITVKK